MRRIFLYIFIASIAASALVGIGVMMFGSFGELETQVFLTGLTVTITSVLGLACGASLEAGRLRIIPAIGIACSAAAAVLWIATIWTSFNSDRFIAKLLMTFTLLAASASHISLLSLARLSGRYLWAMHSAHTVVWSLTALALVCIWLQIDPSMPLIARSMGVLAILAGTITVLTPVFHKLGKKEDSAEEIDREIEGLRRRIAELEDTKRRLTGNE